MISDDLDYKTHKRFTKLVSLKWFSFFFWWKMRQIQLTSLQADVEKDLFEST